MLAPPMGAVPNKPNDFISELNWVAVNPTDVYASYQIDRRHWLLSTWGFGRSKSRLGMPWQTTPSWPHSDDLTGKIELFQLPIWSIEKSDWPALDPYLWLLQFPSTIVLALVQLPLPVVRQPQRPD